MRVQLQNLSVAHKHLEGKYGKIVKCFDGDKYAVQLSDGSGTHKYQGKNLRTSDTFTADEAFEAEVTIATHDADRRMSYESTGSHWSDSRYLLPNIER